VKLFTVEAPRPNGRDSSAQVSIWMDEDLIAGELRSAGGGTRPFAGWIELLAVLEEWRASEAGTAPSRSAE
jgi:hypothetical protein